MINNRIYLTGAVVVDTAQGSDVGLAEFNDTTGALEWISTYDYGQSYPHYNDAGTGIVFAIDNSSIGNNYEIYISGITQESHVQTDFLIQNYDLSGNLDWTQMYDHAGLDDVAANIYFNNVNLVVTGIGQRYPYSFEGIAREYDLNGSVVGATSLSPLTDDTLTEVHDIAIYPNGDIYMVGQLYNPVTGKNSKIIKLDNAFNLQWEYTSTDMDDDEYNFIVLDSCGHVYTGGYKTNGGNKDLILTKIDTSGSIIWGPVTYNGTADGEDVATAAILDHNGELMVTGYSEVDSLNLDYYTIKYDTAGNVIWSINYNGLANKNDRACEIAIDEDNSIYVIGQSQDSSGVRSNFITVKYVEHELFNVPDSDTIPSSFDVTPNWGQLLNADTLHTVNTTVKYYTSTPETFFENNSIIHLFSKIDTSAVTPVDTLVRIDMILTSDTTKKVFAMDKWSYYSNYYFTHTESTKGLVNIPSFKKLVYPEIYNKIDMYVSATNVGIKEQFVLKQGADPKDIAFVYDGADTVYIDNDELIIASILDTIRYKKTNSKSN